VQILVLLGIAAIALRDPQVARELRERCLCSIFSCAKGRS
jgi:hypothetical protein